MDSTEASVVAKVFISHSHRDRTVATELQGVLEKHEAETYLDHDKIQVADVLPDRIRQGIEWCNRFLLLWSSSAAASEWVGRECKTALRLSRKIIPYRLDQTLLPPRLKDLVYLDRKDAQVAHAGLLRAVIGDILPPPTEVFPGRWRLTLDAFGFGTATHDLELRANGQITGSTKIDRGGPIDELLKIVGASDLLDLLFSISGSWEYEEHTEILTLDMVAHGFDQEFRERVQIRITGREIGEIQGKDFSGRPWAMRRVPDSGPFISRWADGFPKYIPGKSTHGEGIPRENIETRGLWECTARILRSQLKLTFMADQTDQGNTFSGEWCTTPVGILSFLKINREGIKGTWAEVWDVDKKLLLGIFLDGLKSGAPFKLVIPIHRRLGGALVGTDAQGITYSSRNVQPKRESL